VGTYKLRCKMINDQRINNRQSIRLKHYDYSQNGLYFITVCIDNHHCLLGNIVDGVIQLNGAGEMVAQQWSELSVRFDGLKRHDYVVMPNHFHGIVELNSGDKQLGDIVGAFKSLSTNAYIAGVKFDGWTRFSKRFWHRNYFEHVIRDEAGYLKISEYIKNNVLKWGLDRFYR